MDRVVTLVDDSDKALGNDTWTNCHFGKGHRHRGFVVLLQDDLGNVYLQKRKHKVFDGLWDLTSISHPYLIGKHQETLEEAGLRSLKTELGIGKRKLTDVGAFVYFAKDGKWCENEYCHIFVGKFDGKFKPNLELVYDAKKVTFEEFIEDIAKNPKKYTPWARLAAEKLESHFKTPVSSSRRVKLDKPSMTWRKRGSGFSIKSRMTGKAGSGEFHGELEKFLKIFEPYQKSYFAKRIKETSYLSPLVAKFYKDLADFSSRGKKIRSFLVWLGYQISGGKDIREILPPCLAFEMTQSFFLIHDDIIDNADLRRGKPTIHKMWGKKLGDEYGRSMAIVLGDIACLEIFNPVNASDFEPATKVKCVQSLLKILLETAYGQAMDIHNAYRKPTFSEVYEVNDLKSARYSFVGPLSVGATLAGASSSQIAAIEDFGLKAGLAFQIQDDILGVFGEEKTIGKSVLSDMREGKNTILIHKTRELATGRQRETLAKLWGKREGNMGDLMVVRGIIADCGARQWCKEENRRLVGQAKKYIPEITGDKRLGQVFAGIADFVIERDK